MCVGGGGSDPDDPAGEGYIASQDTLAEFLGIKKERKENGVWEEEREGKEGRKEWREMKGGGKGVISSFSQPWHICTTKDGDTKQRCCHINNTMYNSQQQQATLCTDSLKRTHNAQNRTNNNNQAVNKYSPQLKINNYCQRCHFHTESSDQPTLTINCFNISYKRMFDQATNNKMIS